MKFLFHPRVTVAMVVAGLMSLAGSCASFMAALEPVARLPFLLSYAPFFKRIDGDLMAAGLTLGALAGLLQWGAGAGRSFITAVDNAEKPA